eukprot:7250844-Prymnesium_polylepis.2
MSSCIPPGLRVAGNFVVAGAGFGDGPDADGPGAVAGADVAGAGAASTAAPTAVSYTHLTLPTICSV